MIEADGSIGAARVVARSGRKRFDKEALELVKKAVSGGGPTEEKHAIVTRWAVEAWVEVAPLSPTAGFSFDENTGKVGLSHPGKKGVQTNVKLISSMRAKG